MGEQLHLYEDGTLTGVIDVSSRTAIYWGTYATSETVFEGIDGGLSVYRPDPENPRESELLDALPEEVHSDINLGSEEEAEADDSEYVAQIESRFAGVEFARLETSPERSLDLPVTRGELSDDVLDLLDEASESVRERVLEEA